MASNAMVSIQIQGIFAENPFSQNQFHFIQLKEFAAGSNEQQATEIGMVTLVL